MGKALPIVAFTLSLLFFIPFAPIVGVVLGFMTITKPKKAKQELKSLAYAAIVIGILTGIFNLIITIALIVALVQEATAGPFEGGGLTNGQGEITVNIQGEMVTLSAIDETTGEPIENMGIGFAKHEDQAIAVAVILDPEERYPPQFQIIYDEDAPFDFLTGAVSHIPGVEPKKIPLPVSVNANAVVVAAAGKLPGETGETIGDAAVIKDLLGLGLKVLVGSVPDSIQDALAAKYNLDVGTTERVTLEEAKEKIRQGKTDSGITSLVTMPLSSPQGFLAGTVISMTSAWVDEQAVGVCEEVGSASGIEITTIGPFMYYGDCQYGGELPEWPAVIHAPTSGSLELFSKTNVGYGKKVDLVEGENVVYLPEGDFETVLRVEDNEPTVAEINVNEEKQTVLQFAPDSPTLTIKPPLEFSVPQLSSGTEGVEFSESVARAKGGDAPYYYYWEGNIPDYLYVTDEGVVEGTPFEAGTYAFEICVSDANFDEVCDETSINIEEDPGECDDNADCERLYGGNYDCFDNYCEQIGECDDNADCENLYGSSYVCSRYDCVYDAPSYAPSDDSGSDQPPVQEDPSETCGPQPVYDQSGCNGLPSGYPSFQYENCLTAYQDSFYLEQVAYNDCLDSL